MREPRFVLVYFATPFSCARFPQVVAVEFRFVTNETGTRTVTSDRESLLLLLIGEPEVQNANVSQNGEDGVSDEFGTTFWFHDLYLDSNTTALSIGDDCPSNTTTHVDDRRAPFPVTIHLVDSSRVIHACDTTADLIFGRLFVAIPGDSENVNSTIT